MLCSFILMMTDDLIHLDTWKQRRKVLVGKASLKCLSGSIYPLTKQQWRPTFSRTQRRSTDIITLGDVFIGMYKKKCFFLTGLHDSLSWHINLSVFQHAYFNPAVQPGDQQAAEQETQSFRSTSLRLGRGGSCVLPGVHSNLQSSFSVWNHGDPLLIKNGLITSSCFPMAP